MNRYILTIIIVFSSIIFMKSEANACVNELPIPGISDTVTRYEAIGTTVYFHGDDSSDPDITPNITKWWWQIYYEGEYDPEYTSGELSTSTMSYPFSKAGYYRIALWVKGDDGDNDWTPAPYEDAAKCYVYVVKIDNIQYKIGTDAYQDCPGTLVVAKGADVTFKAVKDPSGASWPSRTPHWILNGISQGYGEEKTVSFDTASSDEDDFKVMTVTCGNMKIVTILVVDLSTLTINANRTSGPVESSFSVKYNEHFELGATFNFDLMLGNWPTPVKMGAEIWDLDLFNQRLVYGTGTSISHTFGTGTYGSYDDGTCDVCFYFDNDSSGNSTSGDPQVDSYDFEVQSLTYHYLDFGKSSAVSGTPGTTAVCSAATALIRRKDTADDWRATAMILPSGTLSTIPASTHDPLRLLSNGSGGLDDDDWDHWNDWSYFINYNSDEVIIVDDIFICDIYENYRGPDAAGISLPNTEFEIFLEYYAFSGDVLVHELGHSFLGAEHNNTNINNVMYETTAGNSTLLTQSEAAGFE